MATFKEFSLKISTRIAAILLLIPFSGFNQTTDTYNFTGGNQTWTVPACVASIDVVVAGAQGGTQDALANGGLGAVVTATIPVNPGDVITMIVGGEGDCGNSSGGFNGGGSGWTSTSGNPNDNSCGGGGSSDLLINGVPYIIAAGGGGAGGGTASYFSNDGGDGGCATGLQGTSFFATGGSGGTQTGGGAPGAPWAGVPGTPYATGGTAGQGGNGGMWVSAPGGGGGGGYFGGGGGGNDGCCLNSNGGAGGGGGSSLVPGGAGCTQGSNSGDGYISITWTPAAPIGGVVTSSANPICDGDNVDLTVAGYFGTLQWQSAPTSSGPWTDIPGATNDIYNVTLSTTDDACFRVVASSCGTTDNSTTECIVVNPIPDVVNPGNQLICHNSNTNDIIWNGAVPGTTYDWNNSDPSIGLAASGSGDILAFTGTNPGTTPVTGTIDVTPSANGCVGTTEIFTITVNHESIAGNDSTEALCNYSTTAIDLDDYVFGNNLPGNWAETTSSGQFDQASGIFNAAALPAGTYTFTYTVPGLAPCPDDIATFDIQVEQEVTAGGDGAAVVCNDPGIAVDLNVLLNGNDPGGVWAETTGSGQFNIGSGVFNASDLPGGTYAFTYTMNAIAPCATDIADFQVTVNEVPPVNAGVDISVCDGTPITLTATGAGSGGFYTWDNGVTQSVSFIQPLGTQTYTVLGTDANGCDNIDAINVTVNPVPQILFEADTLLGCVGQVVNFTNMSSPAGDNCVWNFGNGQTATGCSGAAITYLQSGVFDVTFTATTSEGCTNSDTYYEYITIAEWPQPFFTYSPPTLQVGATEAMFENGSLFADWYEWDFGDQTAGSSEEAPTHVFPDVGNSNYTMTLTAYSAAGCSASSQAIIYVEDPPIYYVPNAFTPDGDEHNQYFQPVFTAGFDIYDYHLMIFNKWGEIIFESYNANVGWDGTYGDQGLVEDGVYVWRIEFGEASTDKRHKVHGHVTVLK